jgi:DNA polymerase-3 subunit delta'
MPSTDSLVGHTFQIEQLQADIANGNVAHAYLFAGPPHLGKMAVAKEFGMTLLTLGRSDEETIVVRDQISRLTHPDFLVLDQLWIVEEQENWEQIAKTSNAPQQHREKKNVKSNTISIDDIRALQERLAIAPTSGFLCCMIRSIERLQEAAANAFLKMLEEPPSKVIFLLTTEHRESLLPTLVSRTRTILFHPVSLHDLKPLVAHLDDDDASFILHLSQGAPGKVMRLLKDPDLLRDEKQLHAQADRFWSESSKHRRLQWLMTSAEKSSDIDMDRILLHLGISLQEHLRETPRKDWYKAYTNLLSASRTNTQRGLLLEQFVFAVSP